MKITQDMLLERLNNLGFLTEHHIITFEKYVNPPFELKARKQKQLMNKSHDHKDIELVNPWLITDIDFFGNLHVLSKSSK